MMFAVNIVGICSEKLVTSIMKSPCILALIEGLLHHTNTVCKHIDRRSSCMGNKGQIRPIKGKGALWQGKELSSEKFEP